MYNDMGNVDHLLTLLEILSFATSHYATGMQLNVVYNYLGHVLQLQFWYYIIYVPYSCVCN